MTKTQHKRTTKASIFHDISRNTKCAVRYGYHRDSHICNTIAQAHQNLSLQFPFIMNRYTSCMYVHIQICVHTYGTVNG